MYEMLGRYIINSPLKNKNPKLTFQFLPRNLWIPPNQCRMDSILELIQYGNHLPIHNLMLVSLT